MWVEDPSSGCGAVFTAAGGGVEDRHCIDGGDTFGGGGGPFGIRGRSTGGADAATTSGGAATPLGGAAPFASMGWAAAQATAVAVAVAKTGAAGKTVAVVDAGGAVDGRRAVGLPTEASPITVAVGSRRSGAGSR